MVEVGRVCKAGYRINQCVLALAVFIKRPQADAQIGVKNNIWHSNMYVNLTFGGLSGQLTNN